MKMRTRIGLALSAVLASVCVVAQLLVAPAPAEAYSVNEFNPGNIIDDALFYDGTAMDAKEIQTFLNSKVSRCTLGDPGRPAGGTVTLNGQPVKLANQCLRDYRMDTASRAANQYCSAFAGQKNHTAAGILAAVGKACGISPKVLIAMLEKEQSLVTDSWPSQRQFDVAMGYACPDSGVNGTAQCDPTETGFFQQVYRAAWQFKVYLKHPQNYNYRVGWNDINWNVVDRNCGTSRVYIENHATAALYIYTPYRPNQAALDAGWGTGDHCSAYGNRNFAQYFVSWFGGTLHRAPVVLGDLNAAEITRTGISVRGWSVDPKSPTASRNVQVYIGNDSVNVLADKPRPDVSNAYPGFTANSGFQTSIAGTFTGSHQVCAFSAEQLGCETLNFGTHAPRGDVNSVGLVGENLVVRGWAADRDRAQPTPVHVYVGSDSFATTANLEREDVEDAGFGANRGFRWAADASKWAGTTQEVCVYGINVTPDGTVHGSAPKLKACSKVTFPADAGNQKVQGNLEAVQVTNGRVLITGWAFDPSVKTPTEVVLTVNSGASVRFVSNAARPDVQRVYGLDRNTVGFNVNIPLQPDWVNPATVCVSAVDVNAAGKESGQPLNLGCKKIAWIQEAFRSL